MPASAAMRVEKIRQCRLLRAAKAGSPQCATGQPCHCPWKLSARRSFVRRVFRESVRLLHKRCRHFPNGRRWQGVSRPLLCLRIEHHEHHVAFRQGSGHPFSRHRHLDAVRWRGGRLIRRLPSIRTGCSLSEDGLDGLLCQLSCCTQLAAWRSPKRISTIDQ